MLSQKVIKSKFFQLIYFCCVPLCASKTIATAGSLIRSSNSTNCEELPLTILQRVHGPAFDARYMSINRPLDEDDYEYDDDGSSSNTYKRKITERPSFYVTDDDPRAMSNLPAWNIQWDKYTGFEKETQATNDKVRKKRTMTATNSKNSAINKDLEVSIGKIEKERAQTTPWRCENKVKWIDLGPDYHPSHLRTIECSKDKCYYGQFECKPKHFAVHVLRRQSGACANAHNLKTYGFAGDFAEVWEWVEVAVNFCCDCVVPRRSYYY